LEHDRDLINLIDGKRAVIFDLFHTLTSAGAVMPDSPMTSDILGIRRDEWNRQLLEKSIDRLKGKDTDPVEIIRKMAHSVDPSIPMHIIEEAARNRLEKFAASLADMPAASIRTLERLRSKNKKTALLSNADFPEISGWSKCPAAGLFDCVIFSCEAGLVKPERAIYGLCLERLGERPADCVFVGDGGSDELAGAKNAGLSTVMMTGHIKLPPEKMKERMRYADFVISSLDELV
jgi:putative hydrolase of the HAD superfamily